MKKLVPFAASLLFLANLFTIGSTVEREQINEDDSTQTSVGDNAVQIQTSGMKGNAVRSSIGDNFGAPSNSEDAQVSNITENAASVPASSKVTKVSPIPVLTEEGHRAMVSSSSPREGAVRSSFGDNFDRFPTNGDNTSTPTSRDKSANIMTSSQSFHGSNIVLDEGTPKPSDPSSRSGRTEYPVRVSLAPVHTKTDYSADRRSYVTDMSLEERKIICKIVFDVYEIENANVDSFVFDTHLYEFELKTEKPYVSAGIHCPTKGYPKVFLRVPIVPAERDLNLVIVRDYVPQEQFFRFESAHSITKVLEENETTTNLRKNPIFGADWDKRLALCVEAYSRFKYELGDRPTMVEEAAIYEVVEGEEKELYAAIECRSERATAYLCFDSFTSAVRITFLRSIEELIEKKELSPKSGLENILLRRKIRDKDNSPPKQQTFLQMLHNLFRF